MWMVERCKHLRFTLEARQSLGIVREPIRQDFERYVAPEFHIARPIYLAHPAGANRREDFVRAKASIARKSHFLESPRLSGTAGRRSIEIVA
jgi:hypothetical protein